MAVMLSISPATQSLIDKAYTDKDAALAADALVAQDQAQIDQIEESLTDAEARQQADAGTALAKHQVATASAHEALAALAAELGVQLP